MNETTGPTVRKVSQPRYEVTFRAADFRQMIAAVVEREHPGEVDWEKETLYCFANQGAPPVNMDDLACSYADLEPNCDGPVLVVLIAPGE